MLAAITPADAIAMARTARRVVVVGAPGTGKTSLARAIERPEETLHTDDLLTVPWAAQRPLVATWTTTRDRWVIEGVTAARSLRHGEIDPDLVLWLVDVHAERGPRARVLGDSVNRWIDQYLRMVGEPAGVEARIVRGPLPGGATWHSAPDDRTRPTHRSMSRGPLPGGA